MEHLLRDQVESAPVSSDESDGASHRLLKKELVLASLIMLVLFAVLVGLTWYDSSSTAITDLAAQLTDFVK